MYVCMRVSMYKGREFPVCAGIVTWVFFLFHSPAPCCHTPSQYTHIHTYFTLTHTCASGPAVQCNSLEFRLDKRLRRTCAAADTTATANVHAHARWPWPSIRASSLSRAEKSGAERKRLNAMRMQQADWRNLLPSAAKADGDAVKLKFCPQTAASVAPSNSHTHARMYAHVFIYRYVCVCVSLASFHH